jgi:hypothetical protein
LRNRFYIGEVTYKTEILPGEQPAIMDRALFDAVQQKLTEQWSHRNHAKTKSDHLLTGLLFDDAGHRMVRPTPLSSGSAIATMSRCRIYTENPRQHPSDRFREFQLPRLKTLSSNLSMSI